MNASLTAALPGFVTGNNAAHCSACSTQLPLRNARSDEQPVFWDCARCGARLTGVLNEQAPGDVRFNVYPTQVNFTCDRFEQSPARINDFVRLMLPPHGEHEKRGAPREPLNFAAAAMPMDENRATNGVAFMVLLQNVSATGIAFSHSQPIQEPYVALELWAPNEERLKVIVRVVRMRAVGHFYEIAGELVTS